LMGGDARRRKEEAGEEVRQREAEAEEDHPQQAGAAGQVRRAPEEAEVGLSQSQERTNG
jgi:hypothetical protein